MARCLSIGRLHALVRDARDVEALLRGGADVIQLRNKDATHDQLTSMGKEIRILTRQYHAMFVVNDRPELARAVDADGVHVGPTDSPVAEAVRVVGEGRFVGASIDTVRELHSAIEAGASYVGAGPVFPTSSKSDAGPPLGPEGLSNLVHLSAVPVIAIGGIHVGNMASVLAAGAHGVAVLSAFAQSMNVEETARTFRQAIDRLRLP